jgi:hypothetical protein
VYKHAGFAFSKCSFPILAMSIMQIAEAINALYLHLPTKVAYDQHHTIGPPLWHDFSSVSTMSD